MVCCGRRRTGRFRKKHNCRCRSRSSTRAGSCCNSSLASSSCPHAESFHREHGAGSRWRSGHGMAQHAYECLSLCRLALLRQDEGREVRDGSAGKSRRRASGPRQSLRAIAAREGIANQRPPSLGGLRRTPGLAAAGFWLTFVSDKNCSARRAEPGRGQSIEPASEERKR